MSKWKTFNFEVKEAPTRSNPTEVYVIKNKNADEEEQRVEDRHSPNGPNVGDTEVPVKNTEVLTWKKRWKSGNLLLLALPVFAVVPSATFIIGALIHASSFDSLKLKNRTSTPFVSDVGNYKPYSSIFTFALFLNSGLFLCMALIRYYHVKPWNRCRKSNIASLTCGIISSFGEILTGAFQVSSHYVMHFFGASVYFVFIAAFCCIQSWITYKHFSLQEPRTKSFKCIVISRLLLSVIIVLVFVFLAIFLLPDLSEFNRTGSSVAQTLEWMLISVVSIFTLTFLYEFRKIVPRFSVVSFGP